MDDVIIIGGSFAGLTAASHLARARRSVTILDTGLPRNRFAAAAHNVLGFDGVSPFDIREKALADVLAYPTARHASVEATGIGGVADDFVIRTLDGGIFNARRVLLAYGVRDIFPDIPGFAECWGHTVFHCPYCHGYEVADGRLGLLYTGPWSMHGTVLLKEWTSDLTLLTNGIELSAEDRATVEERGVAIRAEPIAAFVHEQGKMIAVRFADGTQLAMDGVLANPRFRPSARLHEDIGVATTETALGPHIAAEEFGQTSVPGIFAAGDVAIARQAINVATYSGMNAGIGIHRSLLNWS
jgi:thioredoxin reductase